MQINGMDAASMIKTNTDVTAVAKANTNTVQKKGDLLENKSISSLTEFDKMTMPVAEKVLIDAIERANKSLAGTNRKFEVSVHEKTNDIMVKVINTESNEVIREIPPEKILDLVAKLWELAGIIVDERR
ncbi:flagellar biosynthesis protein FlaG [Clostridium thermosuccinogenes]|uniref:Flagellar biosynthesis protein FlaG n=1 Tax=Clostridium thermosuccinogenes TaxID=84032 RepID=A0A2K2FK77_9CLOT|nr:flagellar protein FlaG [Pseudoclostridium thermosuccinogenes]AUS95100.1 flagellar biosynthesis protein FlaG [Pseudoclostridium thermosuccinogenes]PNT99180.1 flagellar biosynthesis protein FlaG [Pseudoclostridium thermosuccinogenes]PNU00983.1 flagellar biosynthesis protein FlaG [Pseudoclostridium thermosuccinogenes]